MKFKNLLFILIGIAFLSSPANAEITFSETFSFNGGGTSTETFGTNGAGLGFGGSIGEIHQLFNNFDQQKTPTTYTFSNKVMDSIGPSLTVSLTAAANGINQNFTTFTSTVGGTFFGSGSIGWIRTTGNNFQYKIIFDNLNSAYASTLIGKQEIVLTYNSQVFVGYMSSNAGGGGDVGQDCNYNYFKVYVVAQTRAAQVGWGCVGDGAVSQSVSFTFADTSTLTFNNLSANFGYVNLSKNSFNQRINITNSSGYSYYDTTSTANVAFYALKTSGLIAKVYDVTSGLWANRTLVDSNGNPFATPVPPGGAGTNPVNITKPSTGGIVGFDKSSYFVGDNVNISWYFSDDTWNNFNGKRLYLLLNGNPISESLGCGSIDCIEISTQSGYYIFQATQLGTLQAILREGIFFYSDVPGGSASVQILPPGNSWIALNQTIAFAKNPVNVTYHIGYSVASYPAAVIEIDTIDIATGNTVDSVFPTVFPDGVINIGVIHPLPKGNYSIKLYDAVKNVYLDTKYLTMIVPNVQIPGQGITVSNISTDKTLYFYNDWMTVNFAVDDTNFSNYNYTLMMHVIALDRSGIVTKMIISPMQDQVGTFTTLVNIDKNTKCEQKLNCWFETGNNSINIVLMNSTASVTIAYANFTVSSTTVDGYGLQLSTTTPQSNVQFTITTTVPTLHTGRLRIVTTGSGNISAIPDQTVNAGISTLPATISIVNNFDKAYYNVELYGDDGILKVRIPTTVTQQIKPLTTSEINAMDKIDSWTALFGLGINPTSKFIFGMMITLLIAACGVILVKNDRFIGAALFGAIPFLFFSYISYFPIVVPVIVGIIIALKFRFL